MKLKNEQIEDIKKIINGIVNEEKVSGFDYDVAPLTIIEYYKNPILKKKMTINRAFEPLKAKGFYDIKERDICIFINGTNKVNFPKKLASIIKTTYHEIRHFQQYNEEMNDDYFSYEDFIKLYEIFLITQTSKSDYKARHDEYFLEIDANVYGISKTKEYLEKHNLLTEENRIFIEEKSKEYQLDYDKYDIQLTLKKFHEICQNKHIKNIDFWFFDIFYTNDLKKFKSINEIMSNPDIEKIDKRIIRDILSSEHFIKSVDFSTISEQEKNILMNALNETLEIYTRKRTNCIKQFQQETIDSKNWLKLDTKISNKISFCYSSIERIYKSLKRDISQIEIHQHYSNLEDIVEKDRKTSIR